MYCLYANLAPSHKVKATDSLYGIHNDTSITHSDYFTITKGQPIIANPLILNGGRCGFRTCDLCHVKAINESRPHCRIVPKITLLINSDIW